jgi:hypothetical protein
VDVTSTVPDLSPAAPSGCSEGLPEADGFEVRVKPLR